MQAGSMGRERGLTRLCHSEDGDAAADPGPANGSLQGQIASKIANRARNPGGWGPHRQGSAADLSLAAESIE